LNAPFPNDPTAAVVPALLRARYGRQPGAEAAAAFAEDAVPAWNPVLDTLLGHRSVRAFRADPLPTTALAWLIAAAQSAPSSSNLQAWSVVAVHDRDRKARLAALAGGQAHVREAPLLLVWLVDLARLESSARRAGLAVDGLHYQDTFLMGAIDAALAAQNALTAAESIGLGSVYIGALRNQPEAVAAELGLPPRVHALFGQCIGWPDATRPSFVKPRLAQAAVLSHERYAPATADDIARYDAALQDFFGAQGQSHPAWTAQTADRLRDAAALKGRHRLVEALRGQGFELR
jgi:nitroreductase